MRPTHYLSRRAVLAGLGITAVAATLAACATSGSSGSKSGGAAGEGDASQVDVVTWWSAGSEKLGLDALVKVFNQQFPKTKFENKAVSGGAGSQAKQKLAADLAAKNPPDTYQAHAGAEIKDHIEAGYLLDVSSLYEEFKLNEAFPATLMDRLKDSDGKIYSVPSNIHRANVVWASVPALKAAGLDPTKPATTIDAWIADMEKVKAAGLTPITMGMARAARDHPHRRPGRGRLQRALRRQDRLGRRRGHQGAGALQDHRGLHRLLPLHRGLGARHEAHHGRQGRLQRYG